MAKGYWDRWPMHMCRDCRSGPKAKFCCPLCGWVIKAPWNASPLCSQCKVATPLVCMGDRWRPAKKRHWKSNVAAAQDRLEYLARLGRSVSS